MMQLILSVLFLFIVGIGALVGLIRGMNKTIIRFITFVFAIILALCISAPITHLISDKILVEGQTLGEILLESIRSEAMIAEILDEAPLLQEAILIIPDFALAIVVLPLVFLFCIFISWVVFRFIQKPLRKIIFKENFVKHKKNKEETLIEKTEELVQATVLPEAAVLNKTAEIIESASNQEAPEKTTPSRGVRFGKRMAGMGIGAVIGVLIFGIIFSPILGIFSILPENSALNEAIDAMVSQEILESELASIIKNELGIRESALFKFYGGIGISFTGKTYLAVASRIKANGQKTTLPAEFNSVFDVVQTAIEGKLFKAALNQNQNELFTVLSNQDFVNELMQNLLKSKLFRSAVPKITALAMETVAKSLNVPADKNAVYNNMMDDIATAVKNSNINYELIKAYEDSPVAYDDIDFTDVDSGVQTPIVPTKEEYEAEITKIKALEEKISQIINASVSGSNETVSNMIAEQILMNIEAQVMENGANGLADFTANDVKSIVSSISENNTKSGEASLNKVLEKMNDPEKFETDLATVETISSAIFESVSNAVEDNSKSKETASTLANVVSNFAGAVSTAFNENGQIDVAKLDFEKISNAVTTLQNSTLKEVGSSVLDIVIAGDLGDNEMISNAVAAIKESYDNGENISGTINSAGALIVLGTTINNGSASAENIADSFRNLVQNLDETTMNMLPSILSDETFATLGVAEKHRELAYNAMESLLLELMSLKNTDNYDNEVNTILAIYDIFTQNKNNLKEHIPNLIDQALQSDVLLNTLYKVTDETLSPEILTSFGVSEKAAHSAYAIFKTFLNEVKICRQNGIDAYEHEAFTIKFIYNLTQTNIKDITEEDIQQIANAAAQSDAVYNTLMSITESNPFGINITNEETRANLIQAIETAFAESNKTDKDAAIFTAIARVIGLDAEINLA